MNKTEVKQMLEALRSGVVPKTQNGYFQILHQSLQNQMTDSLSSMDQGVSFVKWLSGSYGTGKSLFMKQVAYQAGNKGYITSTLSLSSGLRMNLLDQWYYGILHHLQAQRNSQILTSFDDLFTQWIDQVRSEDSAKSQIQGLMVETSAYHRLFARTLVTYIRARINGDMEMMNASASWLSGEKNIPLQLKQKLEVKGEVNKHNTLEFLQGFLHLIHKLGYKGLIVFVDEAEMLLYERQDIRQSAYENLRLIIDWVHDGTLENCSFVFSGTPSFYQDEEKGVMSHEALSQRMGLSKGNERTIDKQKQILSLKALPYTKLEPVSSRIADLYRFIYPFALPTDIKTLQNWTFLHLKQEGFDLKEVTIRTFIQRFLEILDYVREHPSNHIIDNELELVENQGQFLFINRKLQKM